MSAQTLWISPTEWISGDPTLRLGYPSVQHPAVEITATAPGDLKWVFVGLRLPTGILIKAVRVCYQLSSKKSFISQVRLTEMQAPDVALVRHDDATDLLSTDPTCYVSTVGAYHPEGAVTLALRLKFAKKTDKITLGSVGVDMETCEVEVANVKCFGAKADGSTDDSLAIQNAINSLTSGGVVFFPVGQYVIGSASGVTVPANVALKIENGAVLNLNSGITLAINGPFIAELCQVFNGSGTVNFGSRILEVFPEWWDDDLAKAVATGKNVRLAAKTYDLGATSLQFAKGYQTIEGSGWATVINYSGADFAIICQKAGCTLRNLKVKTSAQGIDFRPTTSAPHTFVTRNRVENCFVQGSGRGAAPATNIYCGIKFTRSTREAGKIVSSAYYNWVSNSYIMGFNRCFLYDAPADDPNDGGNGNICIGNQLAAYWHGHYLMSIENTISDGFVYSAPGNSATEYSIVYKLTNAAFFNNIRGVIGEAGVDTKLYEIDSGCNNNWIEVFDKANFSIASTDAGTGNSTSSRTASWVSMKEYSSLAENTYYKIKLSPFVGDLMGSLIRVTWWSRNISTEPSHTEGEATLMVERVSGVVAASVTRRAMNTRNSAAGKQTLGSARFVGTEISNNDLYLVFFVSNNGTGTTSCKLTVIAAATTQERALRLMLTDDISTTAAPSGAYGNIDGLFVDGTTQSLRQIIDRSAAAIAAGAVDFSAQKVTGFASVSLTANITSIILPSSPADGQLFEIHWTQDAAGGRTISGWPASVRLQGGSFTMTAAANKTDVQIFRYNGALSKWAEIVRSQNL